MGQPEPGLLMDVTHLVTMQSLAPVWGAPWGLEQTGKGEQTSLKQPRARGDPAPCRTTTFCSGPVQPDVCEPPCSEPGPGHAPVTLLRGGVKDGLLHR